MSRVLVVWCADWPVVAAGIDGDAQPVAVIHANRVVACSAAARAHGIRRGLRRREAQSRCPDVVILPVDPAGEARAFEPVVAAVATLTPRVEVVRPGVCAIATRGPSRYFGGDAPLADTVVATVPVPCRVGIADSVFAAWLAARRATGADAPTAVVPPGEAAAFLAPFPLAALDGRDDLVDLLRRLGIRTLGELAALPVADVVARFGPAGEAAHRLASGLDERPLAAQDPPPDLVVTVELDPPAERADVVTFAVRGLAAELHERLARRGLACTRIAIEAETEHGESMVRVWRAEEPLTAAAMADRVRWQIDGWLNGDADVRPTAGITQVRLVPDEVVPDDGRQLGFWGGSAEADERAGRAFARLQGLFGPDAVTTAVVVGGRGPADAVTRVRWGDACPKPASQPWPGALPPPAPGTVWRRPLPVDVTGTDGRPVTVGGRLSVSAPPARVGNEAVTGWAGPWPVDERWWDPPAHRRRARFQVTVASGAAHLLVLEAGEWKLEATYD